MKIVVDLWKPLMNIRDWWEDHRPARNLELRRCPPLVVGYEADSGREQMNALPLYVRLGVDLETDIAAGTQAQAHPE